MKNNIIKNVSYILFLFSFIFPISAYADISMGSGGISEVYVLENGQLDPGTFPIRVIYNSGEGYCVDILGTSGVGQIWNWSSECGAYFSSIGDVVEVTTETDGGNPNQTAFFYVNCQDPTATNYDPTWTIDTGTCMYPDPEPAGADTYTDIFFGFFMQLPLLFPVAFGMFILFKIVANLLKQII